MALIYSFERDPRKREVVDGNSLSTVYHEEEGRFLTESETWSMIDRYLEKIFEVLKDE